MITMIIPGILSTALLKNLRQSFIQRRFVKHNIKRLPNPPGKPPVIPPARTKRYTIIHVPWQDAADVQELVWRRHAYNDAVATYRAMYKRMNDEQMKGAHSQEAIRRREAEEFQDVLRQNDEENRRIGEKRKERINEEKRRLEEATLNEIDALMRSEEQEIRDRDAEVQAMIIRDVSMATEEKEENFYECEDVPAEFQDAQDAISTATTEPKPGQSESELVQETDEYAVDETHLKELESLMSEEERQEHHQRSLDIKKDGNGLFVEQRWEEAAKIYTNAILECPPSFADVRAILYSNRAACFIKMEQHDQAIADCSRSIEIDPVYVKAYFRRAQLYEMNEETWDKALEDYKVVIRLQPNDKTAIGALIRLPPMINDRNERMKADMVNKLKDLGNMFLRPFGLSTENFKLEQNAEGGYSVQMKK